ncbi:hypothetical protein HAX54_004496 [Datura stramonium]|uniref:Uncharacterized protein n=1 Tax=Datura stramonium TaxID=4076 RepID=A0ABS8WUZ8_DATST|nr:hypothetical protein [Datura stramonium]
MKVSESTGRTPARTHRNVKFKDREDSNIALPIYICHDRRSSLDFSKNKSRRPFSSTTSSVHSSQKSNVKSTHVEGNITRRDEPAIDEIAIRAVISILTGFVGQYSRDRDFREAIKEKCYACFLRKKNHHSDDGIFADIELAIESIERLVDSIDDSKRSWCPSPAVPSVFLPLKWIFDFTKHGNFELQFLFVILKISCCFGPITERGNRMDDARNGIWEYEEEGEEKISANGDDSKQGNILQRKQRFIEDHRVKATELQNMIYGLTLIKIRPLPACSCQSHPFKSVIWLDSHGDPETVKTLSTVPVIEGIMNVLFASEDDEILEMLISILADLVTRKETNGQIILNSDPQLDIFLRLLRSSSLFLKAAILLYLVQPKAKQMISVEWIPLVLRVLEFADQLQTLFTVQRSPQEAAYYLLDQLLTGFDEDKNFEINQHNTHGHVFALLAELLCIDKQVQRIEFLRGLLSGWGMVNTLHILLLYLQRAQQEERPIISAILLQLDLLSCCREIRTSAVCIEKK